MSSRGNLHAAVDGVSGPPLWPLFAFLLNQKNNSVTLAKHYRLPEQFPPAAAAPADPKTLRQPPTLDLTRTYRPRDHTTLHLC